MCFNSEAQTVKKIKMPERPATSINTNKLKSQYKSAQAQPVRLISKQEQLSGVTLDKEGLPVCRVKRAVK